MADAAAHRKYIGYAGTAAPLLEKAGADLDEGFVPMKKAGDAETFVTACRKLRFWGRAGAER